MKRSYAARLGVAALAVPCEQLPIVLDELVIEVARVHELLEVHTAERILTKGIDARLRGGPLPRQSDLVSRSKVLDARDEQAVQRTGLVGANQTRIPLDDPIDPVICVVFGRSGPVLLSIPLAAPHAREVGQHRENHSTDRQRNLEHACTVPRLPPRRPRDIDCAPPPSRELARRLQNASWTASSASCWLPVMPIANLFFSSAAACSSAERTPGTRLMGLSRPQSWIRGALAWELRGATSLAGLWHLQPKTSQARTLLPGVYRRFTEGFDTADVVTATAVLQSLR